jgi:thiamine biosynthesis lipoprotein
MKKLYTAIITALIATQICGCSDSHNYITSDGAMLGTTFHVCTDVLGLTPTELYNEMMRIDSEAKSSLSIFNPESLLSRINRGETDSLNHHLLYNLTLARTLGEKYDTRYDVTVKPLTDAWGFAAKNADKWLYNIAHYTFSGSGYPIYYAFLVKCGRFVQQFQKPLMTPMLVREP